MGMGCDHGGCVDAVVMLLTDNQWRRKADELESWEQAESGGIDLREHAEMLKHALHLIISEAQTQTSLPGHESDRYVMVPLGKMPNN